MQRAKPNMAWLVAVLAIGCTGASAADSGRIDEAAAASIVPAPSIVWRPAADGQRGRRATALALEPGSERLAIGDEQGVRLGAVGGVLRRVLHRGPVRDLAFLPAGGLLVATEGGLYRIDAVGPKAPIAPGPGASARSVQRVAVLPGLDAAHAGVFAAATDAGVFVSADEQNWQRLSGNLPTGPATALALRRDHAVVSCWTVVGGQLWRIDLAERSGRIEALEFRRETIAFAGRERGAVDVVSDLPEADIAVVFPKLIALRRADSPPGSWEIVRPELPAGGELWRLGHGAGLYWLATDRGLLLAGSLRGPWRRASAPVGTSSVQAAVGSSAAIYVAANAGIFGGRVAPERLASTPGVIASGFVPVPVTEFSSPTASDEVVAAGEPAVGEVHRVAIRYLGLDRTRLEALREGVGRRGWLPIVVLRGDGDWDRSRTTDYDQAFLSGETRHLIDIDRDRGDSYGVSLTLSWDLGDIAYEPESLDVSHETREVIELRDDVLDEITQLYFERRRVLAALAASVDLPSAASLQLRLRASELAAGIDAWTGGWFSERLDASTP
jgi:hypothetical protein